MSKDYKKTGIFLVAAFLVYIIITALFHFNILDSYYASVLTLVCINIIMAVSLNLIIGFTGQLALGHAGFMSIGGYAAAMFTLKLHVPFLIAIIIGGIFAAVIGILIGLPILRLKGDYLAITTLGLGEIIRVAIQNLDFLGGASGLPGIPLKSTFEWVFAIMVVTILIIYRIIHSSQGRAMISVREDEIAAEAMGINTTKYKIVAFALGSFFAGVGGGLYAHFFTYMDPVSFNFLKSFDIVTYVVLGGMGSLTGSVISAGLLTFLPEVLRAFNDYRMIIYPIALILIMRFRPQGLLGSKELSFKVFDNLFKRGDKDGIA
jgi:branched-chain amino acid transport system permease protein